MNTLLNFMQYRMRQPKSIASRMVPTYNAHVLEYRRNDMMAKEHTADSIMADYDAAKKQGYELDVGFMADLWNAANRRYFVALNNYFKEIDRKEMRA